MSWVSVTETETIDWGAAPVAGVGEKRASAGAADAGRGLVHKQGNASQSAASLGANGVGVGHAHAEALEFEIQIIFEGDRDGVLEQRKSWPPRMRLPMRGESSITGSDTVPGRNSLRGKPEFIETCGERSVWALWAKTTGGIDR